MPGVSSVSRIPSANSRTPFAVFFFAQELLFGRECFFALRRLRVGVVLRFVLGKDRFDTGIIQRQGFALVGLLETIDQRLDLQV